MSLKERLFGHPWESRDATTRLHAVQTGNDTKMFAVLADIARDDPAAEVRLAALKRFDDESMWLGARASDDDAEIRAAADRALIRTVTSSASENPGERVAWVAGLEDRETLRRLATEAADAAVRRAALARIDAQGFLGDALVGEPDEEVAAELLSRIDQPSTLKRIAGPLRKRHKQRHQALLKRLAALEGRSGRHDAADELAMALVQRIESLARGAFRGDREAEADRLEAEWKSIEDPDEGMERRFSGALAIVRRSLEPQSAVPPAEQPASPAEANADLLAMTEEIQSLAGRRFSAGVRRRFEQLSERFAEAWAGIGQPSDPDRTTKARFEALADEIRSRAAGEATSAPAENEAAPSRESPDSPPVEELLAELDDALTRAAEALEGGDIVESDAAVRAARSAFDRIPRRQQPDEASGRLTRMAGRLKEMRNWQHWSNNKLRERLIERAEELAESELHADAITARLKELRARWKELDAQEVLPGDKRRFAAPHSQWRRFQAAAKQAFDTARPYFEKRHEVQDRSLEELESFVDDAAGVAGDDEAPQQKLLKYLRAARQAIRNLDELPPKARGRMAGRLRSLMDDLSAGLDRHFDAVEREKRRLVAEARKLAHEKDRSVAVERAKSLQAEWKNAGRARRKVDDELWKEFREPIDPLFEELKASRKEEDAAERERVRSIETLCQRAEELASAEDDALDDAAGPLAGLEAEFTAQEPIPPHLRRRFEAALAKHRDRQRERRVRLRRESGRHLAALAEALQAGWRAREEQAEFPDAPDVDDDDPLQRRLGARLADLRDGDADALAAEVEQWTDDARQVVIEMEFLSGTETPEKDRQRRMDYQIQRLSSRMAEGAPRPDLDAERDALQRRWLESHPHALAEHDDLVGRFEAADRILQQMTEG
ncbi:MAG: DUF349 domain-containing protein [Wenzhouxiangellaceae bacterium]|nr:DUF349 domain-containing protein [Wenzhouxiangellaceae bacterium]